MFGTPRNFTNQKHRDVTAVVKLMDWFIFKHYVVTSRWYWCCLFSPLAWINFFLWFSRIFSEALDCQSQRILLKNLIFCAFSSIAQIGSARAGFPYHIPSMTVTSKEMMCAFVSSREEKKKKKTCQEPLEWINSPWWMSYPVLSEG